MNTLILNRESFALPNDGWYQIAPRGEFAHAQAGLVQVVDSEACDAMVNRFREEAGTEPFDKLRAQRFAGLLVDFDHFSLDGEKRSEAAGWVVGLENRDGGLFAKIRWSDLGEEAVKGGRYRFLSPVWSRGDCVDLGNGRVRPVRLLNAAVTNDPNLKGMVPLSNRGTGQDFEQPPSPGSYGAPRKGTKGTEGGGEMAPSPLPSPSRGEGDRMRNAATSGAQRFKWVLGSSPEGHCPSCAALAGQVRTMAEWQAGGAEPGAGGLYCQGNCHCSLEPTNEPATGSMTNVPVRKGGWKNMQNAECRLPNEDEAAVKFLVNTGWTRLRSEATPGQADEALIHHLANTGWTDEARAASLAARRAKAGQRKQQKQGAKGGEQSKHEGEILAKRYEHEGFDTMKPEDVDQLTETIRQKLTDGEEALSPVEQDFLRDLVEHGQAGESDADPIFQWAERDSMQDQRMREMTGMDAREARDRATELERRQLEGEELNADEAGFLDMYGELVGNRAVERTRGTAEILYLANTGWTDAARLAALSVRRAKAKVRIDPDGTRHVVPLPKDDGKMYAGGTPYFDERTGKYEEIVLPAPRPATMPPTPVKPKPPKPPPPSPPPKKGIPMPPGFPRRPPPPGWKPPPGGMPPRM